MNAHLTSYLLDTSAFAKLYHREAGTEFVKLLVLDTESICYVSRLSLVEIESVFAIKVRTRAVTKLQSDIARRRMRADLAAQRILVGPAITEKHYELASNLIIQYGVDHGLRTLDAIQLAIALSMKDAGLISTLVTADRRLLAVAIVTGCPATGLVATT